MKNFTLNSFEVNIISLTTGKKYLLSVIELYVVDEEERKICYELLNKFITSIENKDTLYNLDIPTEFIQFLQDKRRKDNVAYRLRGHEDEFQYSHLLYHMENVLMMFQQYREQRKVHLWFKLEPKQPNTYFDLDDEIPEYDNILCKFYLRTYKDYTNQKQTTAEGWTFQLCLLYILTISKLYYILQKKVKDFDRFIFVCFEKLNPIITGFTCTLNYNLGQIPAVCVLYELFQLQSSGTYLTLSHEKDIPSIKFTYTTKTGVFKNSLDDKFKPDFNGDTTGKRKVEVLFTGNNNILTLRIDVVGLETIDDITGLAVKKEFFDLITDKSELDAIGYKVIADILSHTKQFQKVKGDTEDYFDEHYPISITNNKCKNIFGIDMRQSLINEEIIKNTFNTLTSELTPIIAKAFIRNFELKKTQMDYMIIATALAPLKNNEVSEAIKNLGNTQKATIRKMVNFIREFNNAEHLQLLNKIYRKVSYRY